MVKIFSNGKTVSDNDPRTRPCRMPSWDSQDDVMVEAPELPLGIHVVLPAEDVSAVNGVTYFCINVVPKNGGSSSRIMRRYTEFRDLASTLRLMSDLPQKRRLRLEVWLRTALHYQQSCPWMRPLLRKFLRLTEFDTPLVKTPYSAVLAPLAPAQLSPVSAPLATTPHPTALPTFSSLTPSFRK